MHVFDRNAQSLQMKVLAGEIPQTADTALYQTVCDARGISARNGEHRHIRLVALNKLRKRIRAAYLMAAKTLTDELRICVKRTQQLKPLAEKLKLLAVHDRGCRHPAESPCGRSADP